MADEQEPITPDEESKKDTVRINLPPGLTGRPASPAAGGPATVKLKPATQEISAEEESKKETAVMGRPAAVPKAKSDTSRVQVAAKPAAPETPRPTVKLKQPEAPAPSAAPMAPAPAPAVAMVAGPSAVDGVLALAAMVVAVASAVYLFMLSSG
jgi:hypothetical protein